MSEETKGVVGTLMDLSFSEFITTKIVKLLYILGIILVGLSSAVYIVGSFTRGFAAGIISLIIGPIMFTVGVIWTRVWLELIIVIFRIAGHTAKIAGADTSPAPVPEKPAEKNAEKPEEKEGKKEDDKEEKAEKE
jgi:hypothetical protein